MPVTRSRPPPSWSERTCCRRLLELPMTTFTCPQGHEWHEEKDTQATSSPPRCPVCAVAQLQHPNIVQIYEIGEHQGRPYFAMELVEGISLSQALSRNLFPLRETAALIATLAQAVQFAHERGIIHRDLKPGNILLQIA